jgi:NitT/TauT family transport system substrate-binding protein
MNPTRHVLAVLLLVAVIVSACASPPTPAEGTSLKVAALPFLSFSPFFIADEEGYFEAQNLDVEFVRFERGADAIASLISGEIDVWAGAVSASLLNAIQRSPIRIVADRGYFQAGGCGYTAFLLRAELMETGAVQSPADLQGMSLVNEGEGDMRHYFMDTMLASGGLTDEDVQIVSIPDPVMIEAFAEGSIDVAGAGEPWVARNVAAGNAVDWLSFEDVIPDFQFGVIAFGPNLLEENPDVGERFLIAFLEGVEQYNEGKTDRNVEVIAGATQLEPELLIDACWPAYQEDGRINITSILEFQDWLVENAYLESPVEADEFWNSEFIDKINP